MKTKSIFKCFSFYGFIALLVGGFIAIANTQEAEVRAALVQGEMMLAVVLGGLIAIEQTCSK